MDSGQSMKKAAVIQRMLYYTDEKRLYFIFPHVKINKNFEHKIVNNFLPISFNICFGCSKEPSHREGSFEYSQHVLFEKSEK